MNSLILKVCYYPVDTRYLTTDGRWTRVRAAAKIFKDRKDADAVAAGLGSPHVHVCYTSAARPLVDKGLKGLKGPRGMAMKMLCSMEALARWQEANNE